MLATGLMLVLFLVATATDVRGHKIYNWTTYPGIVAALALNAAGTVIEYRQAVSHFTIVKSQAEGEPPVEDANLRMRRILGYVGLHDSLLGLALCGGLMLAAFVFFPGVGGGDVKLMAMLGAFLGLEHGLEALLWTFVLAACLGTIVLIWRVGALRLIGRVGRQILYILRIGGWAELEPAEREQLQFPLFLAPTALAAVLIVEFVPAEILRGAI
jgi:prepilin peptidase CpaA